MKVYEKSTTVLTSISLIMILIIFTVITAITYLPLLGYLPLHLEEPRRAIIAATMLNSGNYWVPIHAEQIYLSKPPLFNWLICITSWPIGQVTAWSARLPSVLSIWIVTLFLIGTARYYINLSTRIIWFWGCALLLSPEILLKGQLAEIDIVFTALVSAAVWSWWLLDHAKQPGLKLWILPLVLTGLAYFTKREPALVFFYLTIGPYLLINRRIKELFSLAHILALLIAMLPVLIWLIMLAEHVGWLELWHNLQREILQRGSHTDFRRYLIHLVTYPLQILGATAPFSLLLLLLVKAQFRQAILARYGNLAIFAAIAVVANLPLYWFKSRAPVRYFLPMVPFLLLIAAMSYEVWVQDKLQVIRTRWEAVLHGFKKSLLLILVILMLVLRGLEFLIYKPMKADYLARTQNAPAILNDIMTHLPMRRPLFVSPHIPSAIWFYAPYGLLSLPPPNPDNLRNGDVFLSHQADQFHTKELPWLEIAKYRYEDNELRLYLLWTNTGIF
ncbi:hypothetical protein TI05_08360 [Achromatium sp. WMS3]|nr:hypothetical protein TI05_08360 [Achromatium sp. WMS3]